MPGGRERKPSRMSARFKEPGRWRYYSFINLEEIFREIVLEESNLLVLDILEFCEKKKSLKDFTTVETFSVTSDRKSTPNFFYSKKKLLGTHD